MERTLNDIIALYNLNNRLLKRCFDAISTQQADRPLQAELPPVNWLLGHITRTRYHIMELLGAKRSHEFLSAYGEPYNAKTRYPSVAEIIQAWRGVEDDLIKMMKDAGADKLNQAIDYDLPHGDKTVLGAIVFFCYHETWHVGQISAQCRIAGLPGLAG